MLGATPPLKADVATRSPRTGWAGGFAWAVAAFVVILGMGALYFAFSGGDGQVVDQTTVPTPATPESPFLGTWVTLDCDGSTPTMTIRGAGDNSVEMLVHDDYASVCSGAPSTMTGTGRLEGTTTMIVPSPVLTCDDGSGPEALSGPPLEEQLRDLTFVHDPESDTLTDNLGSYWNREGAEDPSPEPTQSTVPAPGPETIATGMWPQTNLEEVQEAQELADAGDPDYTWQLDAALAANGEPWGAEIFARFIEEELGWEEFSVGNPGYASGEGVYEEVVFIRCAPGETNPLNSLYADAPPEIRRLCADDRRAQLRDGEVQCDPAWASGSFRDLGGGRMGDAASLPIRAPSGVSSTPTSRSGRSSRSSRHPTLKSPLSWRHSSEPGWTVRAPSNICSASQRGRRSRTGGATPVRHDQRGPLRAIRDRACAGPGMAERLDGVQGPAVRRG